MGLHALSLWSVIPRSGRMFDTLIVGSNRDGECSLTQFGLCLGPWRAQILLRKVQGG
jgi:hypothetical protein